MCVPKSTHVFFCSYDWLLVYIRELLFLFFMHIGMCMCMGDLVLVSCVYVYTYMRDLVIAS